ncbi:MAG: mevalonate kinase [Polyangiaceae bacterium]|nr:mevalonate kinase [Polyangiaceae bacterium]
MATASGKVILLGEHAVVYGTPALAAALDRGASADASYATQAELCCQNESVRPGEGRLGEAFARLLQTLGSPSVRVLASLEIPAGCGLGASAALGVAVARAVVELTTNTRGGSGPEHPRESVAQVEQAAAAWERVFHAQPSGIDAAAASQQGCIYFTRAHGPERIHVRRPFALGVAVAGPPASTRDMVQAVAALRERRRAFVDRSLGLIHSLVEDARRCIESGDMPTLGQLMDLNHMLLAGLMVSTEQLETAVHAARDAGALGAKLTGSGGGGCVIALVENTPDRVLAAWQQHGLPCFSATVGTNPGRQESPV